MNEKKAPEIRFKGFTDDWEQRKLGEVGETYTGLSGKSKDDFGHGSGKFITYMNVFSNPVASSNMTEAIEIDDSQNKVQFGDVLFTTSSETPDEVGMSSVWLENAENTYLNSFCFGYRPTTEYNPYYLAYMLRSSSMRKKITFLAQGISRYNISKNKMMDIEMPIPSIDEQKQIGEYFRNLDNLITLHQRKHKKLLSVKKSMLEKMFPQNGAKVPEIRFEGFTDDWEQRKLGDIAKIINGRAYAQNELLPSGKYKVLRVGNFYTNDSWYYSDLELDDKYYANDGDLLYTWSATFGPHIWRGDRVIYHYHIWKIDLTDELEKHFAVQLLEQDKNDILSGHNGSTMAHITKEGMEQKKVVIPKNIGEQRQLGLFFDNLDHLITLHQRELDKLVNIKKSMLEKMFV
jgi:type I restriction enzyme S subunit